MRAMLLCLAVVWAAGPLMAQAAGPLRPRPRPPSVGTSAPRLPPAPRIGQEPVEEAREAFRYLPPSDPVLAKAIAASIDFQQELPNFVCQQHMTRSSSRDLGKKWKQDDVVAAEILTIGEKVDYRDIKIDGKPIGAEDLSQIGGTWSIGEYGAAVINIFHPRSRTQFTEQGSGELGDRETRIYDYKIDEERSQWKITVDGRSARPAHHGKVWIDAETGRTLRVETEAAYLPHDFPLASVTSELQYGEIEIDGQSYLLPARAANTSCQRGSFLCSRLEMEFLDYRRFSSQSNLFTADSEIEFGDEVPEPSEQEGDPQIEPGK